MLSNPFELGENDEFLDDVTSLVEDVAETGLGVTGLIDGSDLPLRVQDSEDRQELVMEFPIKWEDSSVEVDAGKNEFSISLSGEDSDLDAEELKDEIMDVIAFPSEIDVSSMKARFEENKLVLEGEKSQGSSVEDTEHNEEY